MPDNLMQKMRAHFTPLYSPLGLQGILLGAVVLVLDQASKFWILFGLRLEEIQHVNILPFFSFTMVHNKGISFGLLTSEGPGRWLLVLFQFGMAAVIVDFLRNQKHPLAALSLGLIMGGALGNGIDRARLGYVVDFLDFSGTHVFPWVFNVADSAICIGVALLVWYFIRADMTTKDKDAGQA